MVLHILGNRPDDKSVKTFKLNFLQVVICYFQDLALVINGIDIWVLKPNSMGFRNLMRDGYDNIRGPLPIPSRAK